ncbi:MAG: RluA family pseudouridine synthase [Rectinemataceae bacterium]
MEGKTEPGTVPINQASVEQWRSIHEDADILVVDKLAPLPVQAEKSGDAALQDLLRAMLVARGGEAGTDVAAAAFLEAAHRIDRRASGAVIFAKTHRSLETLEADFREHRIGKRYVACVEKEPTSASGSLVNRLAWDKRKNIVRVLAPGAVASESQEAKLSWKLVARSERYFFLEVELETGRHHQIRAQLAAAGLPIRGDVKYGAKRTTKNGLIMLHSWQLVLTQPKTRETLTLLAPFPETEPLWRAFTGS